LRHPPDAPDGPALRSGVRTVGFYCAARFLIQLTPAPTTLIKIKAQMTETSVTLIGLETKIH